MLKKDKINFVKKDISKTIHQTLGFSIAYLNKISDDIIYILKLKIKNKKLVVKNFGTFKTIYKKERLGRNPKNKKKYIISARKSISFISSKNLSNKIDNI
tara:strand:- start:320 stop:619 length:300 start_codon:yes stop_codon:yes gene_type:complete